MNRTRAIGMSMFLLTLLLTTATACSTDEPTPDPALASLSPDTREALSPESDLLAPAAAVMEAYRGGVEMVFVDARTPNDFEYGHIPGAINVPYFDPLPHLADLPRDRIIISYCECPHAEAVQTAEALLDNGFTRVKVIDEGLAGWLEQGGELEVTEASGL